MSQVKNEGLDSVSNLGFNGFVNMITTMGDLFCRIDLDGRIIYINDVIKEYGFSPEEVIGNTLLDFLHPDDIEKEKQRLDQRRAGDKSVQTHELRMQTKNRGIRYFESKGYATSSGEINSIIRDITDRKLIEQALSLSHNKLSSILQLLPDIVYILDYSGMIIFISDAIEKYGHSQIELIGTDILDIVHPDDRENARFRITERRTDNTRDSVLEIRLLTKQEKAVEFELKEEDDSGAYFNVDSMGIYATPDSKDGNFVGTLGVARDITDRKRTEKLLRESEHQLFQSQKMESIGRLAGGIAHDFNNILTSILGYTQLLELQIDTSEESSKKSIDVVLSGVERAAKLTQQLLGFARQGKYNPVPLNLNQLVKDILYVSEKIFRKNVKTHLDLIEVPNVLGDQSQIDQVLTNIIINARDAMPDGGDFYLKTELVPVAEEIAEGTFKLSEGNYVKLSVTDTGVGMDKEVRKKIFEPFFTTKEVGKGTGLGLATTYGILKNHGGNINVISEPGHGSTFEIYIPATEKEMYVADCEAELIIGKGLILVVDDEEDVRNSLKEQLKHIGYDVLIAEDGERAVALYKEKYKEISCVVLDMIMPNMAGDEAFYKMKRINPDIKVVILSGYSREGKAERLLKQGVKNFIKKPCRIQNLSAVLAKLN